MKHQWQKWLASLGAASLLAACGGGGSDSDNGSSNGNNTASRPNAVLRAAVGNTPLADGDTLAAGTKITLDASGSSTPSGTLAYSWRLAQQPGDDAIDNPQAARTQLTPTLPGDYQIRLTVDNGDALASQQLSLSVTSDHPVAMVERRERNMRLGLIQLDGRASLPPSGGDPAKLKYFWRLVAAPPVSKIAGLDAEEAMLAQPRFDADVPGKYEFELNVSYEGKSSLKPATLFVSVQEPLALPSAVIEPLSSAPYVRGQKISFDASKSTAGTGGGALQYRWSLTKQGLAPLPAMEGANTDRMSFTPNAVDTYTVGLSLFDGVQYHYDEYRLTSVLPGNAPNTPPVAVFLHNYNENTFEIEKGARTGLYGRSSYDIDETGNMQFEYEWTLLEEPAPGAAKLELTGRYSYFTPRKFDGEGVEKYKFQLRVKDSAGAWSEPAIATFSVLNGANHAPTAEAGPARSDSTSFMTGTQLELLGHGSDTDNNRITKYEWQLLDRPDHSQASLSSLNTERTNILLDQPGRYMFQLAVTDSHGAVSILPKVFSIYAKTQNFAPEARPYQTRAYDREQPLLIHKNREQFSLYNTTQDFWNEFAFVANAYDPDGDKLGYLWSLTGLPAGYGTHNASITSFQTCYIGDNWSMSSWRGTETAAEYIARQNTAREWTSCADLSFAPAMTGTYDLTLWVTDGAENAGPFNFSVNAATREDYPSLLLEDLHLVHRWNSTTGKLELVKDWTLSSLSSSQMFFPTQEHFAMFKFSSHWYPYLCSARENHNQEPFVLGTYQLSAGQQDYTIADLTAQDASGNATLAFDGITNGETIKKGETATFSVTLRLNEDSTFCQDSQTDGALINTNPFTWFFRIKEKPEWTFSY